MAKFLKRFQTTAQYNAYAASADFITPNVSLCDDAPTVVHYNPHIATETRVIAKYNVTSTSSPTPIGYNEYTSGFSAIEIDGVAQPTVESAYTFSTTGEHTVKYTLTNPTSIGEYAFSSCNKLASIVIPNGVTSIGGNSFGGCWVLANVDIPDSVTSIGDSAFFGAFSNVPSVTITSKATTAPTLGTMALYSIMPTTGTLYIPQGSDYSSWLSQLGSNWTTSPIQ